MKARWYNSAGKCAGVQQPVYQDPSLLSCCAAGTTGVETNAGSVMGCEKKPETLEWKFAWMNCGRFGGKIQYERLRNIMRAIRIFAGKISVGILGRLQRNRI